MLQANDYTLFNTTDGGNTWNPVTYTGVLRNFGLSAVPGTPNMYVSVGEDLDLTERGSSFSLDSGLTWTSINNAPDTNFVDGGVVEFLNYNTGFASGFSTSATVGGIFKWNAVAYDPELAASAFSYDKSVKVSPNPSKGIVNINGKNISQVVVTDLLGKVIATSNYGALNTVSFDMSAFNAGVYMVKVTSEGGTSSTVKVVKE